MNEGKEKLEILNMIKEGKITPEQGVRLIEALEHAGVGESGAAAKQGTGPRWINIEIRTSAGGKYKSLTPIRIPMSLLRLFLRFIPKDSSLPGSDASLDKVLDSLESGKPIELHSSEGEEGRSIRIIAE
jgi:hypothetical protein